MNTKILKISFLISVFFAVFALYARKMNLPNEELITFLSYGFGLFSLLIFWTEISVVGNLSSSKKMVYFFSSILFSYWIIFYYLMENRKSSVTL